jgi:hypothetical protein
MPGQTVTCPRLLAPAGTSCVAHGAASASDSSCAVGSVLAGLAAPPAARGFLIPGSPRLAQQGIGLARRKGHDSVGLSASCLQLRVSRRALVVRRSRIEPRTRGGGDVFGHALDVTLRQLADGTGADEPGLLARLVPELLAAALDCGTEGSDLR